MPVAEFYGLRAGEVARVAAELREICERRDESAWEAWYARFEDVHLSCGRSRPTRPITDIEDFAGLPRLDPAIVPAPDSASLAWTARQYVTILAPMRFTGTDGFNGEFTDGLNVPTRVPGDEEARVHRMFCERLFMPPPLADSLAILRNPDAYCAYFEPDELATLLEADRRVHLVERLAASLEQEDWSKRYAPYLREWIGFLEEVAESGHDLYYMEYAS